PKTFEIGRTAGWSAVCSVEFPLWFERQLFFATLRAWPCVPTGCSLDSSRTLLESLSLESLHPTRGSVFFCSTALPHPFCLGRLLHCQSDVGGMAEAPGSCDDHKRCRSVWGSRTRRVVVAASAATVERQQRRRNQHQSCCSD